VRYALSLGLLGWLASQVEWRRFAGLGDLPWHALVVPALLAGLAYPLQAWRWQILLHAAGAPLPTRWVHAATWLGQFYSSFLPGGIAGDAVRLGYLWQAAPAQRAAGGIALLVDRLVGLAALFALGAAALALHLGWEEGPAELHRLLLASTLATLGVGAAGALLISTRWWEPLAARLLGAPQAAALQQAARALGARPGSLALATALGIAVWLADFAAIWWLAQSLELPAGPLTIAVAASAAYVASILPLSIGGHGVREGTFVLALGWLGLRSAEHPAVLLLAVGLWALSVVWSLGGGLCLLFPALLRLPARE